MSSTLAFVFYIMLLISFCYQNVGLDVNPNEYLQNISHQETSICASRELLRKPEVVV